MARKNREWRGEDPATLCFFRINDIKIISVFVVGVMAIAITLGAVLYRSVSASPSTNQVANTSSGSTNTNAQPGSALLGRGRGGGPNSYTDALAQAVEKGLITQAQADDLSANGNAFPYGNRWDG